MKDKKPDLEPTILIIFGITGDLSKRKLLPALYHLVKNDLLHEQTEILGITRGNTSLDSLLETIELCVMDVYGECDSAIVQKLHSMLSLKSMDVTSPAAYDDLYVELNSIEDKHGVHMNRLYYLSIPPNVAQPIITFLGQHGLNASCQHGAASTRLLVEKPFGYNLSSARELIEETNKQFGEEQIFRIDHYLAKETVQNILAFRFNNPIFGPTWNANHIAQIEVIANEKLTIEGRSNFYEQTGALRDLIQSHLLQVLALVTMERPKEMTSEAIHASKLHLLEHIDAIKPDRVLTQAIRGQYEGYKDEVGNDRSHTETYAAIQLHIDNDRWKGVPMIVRTGKALAEKTSRVRVVYKPTAQTPHHNILTFRLQPNEGIELSLRVKTPGYETEIQPAEMDFSYRRSFEGQEQPDAYERVLVDAVRGDHTLFATNDEIVESWRIVQSVLDEWAKNDTGLISYAVGSSGPTEVDSLNASSSLSTE